ncbi:MAG: HEPN domain-containing protein [Cyclobacteriaceae bacterium]
MEKQDFNKENLIQYWLVSSDDDYETMEAMYRSKRYSWTLFVGHLMIEKLLKVYYVKVNEGFPPFFYNPMRLAEKSQIELSEENKMFLIRVTAFNINARYDDYKMSFQKKCTPEYTATWISKLKEKRLWIKELIRA